MFCILHWGTRSSNGISPSTWLHNAVRVAGIEESCHSRVRLLRTKRGFATVLDPAEFLVEARCHGSVPVRITEANPYDFMESANENRKDKQTYMRRETPVGQALLLHVMSRSQSLSSFTIARPFQKTVCTVENGRSRQAIPNILLVLFQPRT